MKKRWVLGFGFIFLFLFVQNFVFAVDDSSGPKVTFIGAIPHVSSAEISFKPVSVLNISHCSLFLNSGNRFIKRVWVKINNSEVNKFTVTNLSVSGVYEGNLSCTDSKNLTGAADNFSFSIVSKGSNSSINSSRNNTLSVSGLNSSKVPINNSSNTPKSSGIDSSMKKFVLGVSIGLGLLLIFGGVGYLIWKRRASVV